MAIQIKSGMNPTRPLLIVVAVIASGALLSGQEAPDMTRYRTYALTRSLDAVAAASGAKAGTAKTVHERPALIQELVQRIPYSSQGSEPDPVREITLGFYNDALYRVVVHYDRTRTEGLTNQDVVAAIAATYGPPVLAVTRTPASPRDPSVAEGTIVARWDGPESQLTLMRAQYSSEFQLTLVAKSLNDRARAAIGEAVRLDASEAPGRASDQREKDSGEAQTLLDRARLTNKAVFRP